MSPTTTDDNKEAAPNKEYNVFRDSLLRYLGYANEVGESFRYQFPKLVTPSYGLAIGYCFADAATTGLDTWKKQSASTTTSRSSSPEIYALASAADVLIWQSLASVIIPGFSINMLVKFSRLAVSKNTIALPVMVSTWFPTAVGLGSIPLIIHPIDAAVDFVMDKSIRAWWKHVKKDT
jgi:mitochondrial fission process protein 1